MLFYNPNIRRKVTYKRSLIFGKPQERVLYSYSIYEDFEVIEFVFDEKTTKKYQYNIESNFLDSLRVYNENNELNRKYFFDITKQDDIFLEFKESYFKRDNQAGCFGKLEYENSGREGNCNLTFHRVDSYLGYKIKLKIFRNDCGDFSVEEYYSEKNDELQYILENEFEYFESGLEVLAKNILRNGWN